MSESESAAKKIGLKEFVFLVIVVPLTLLLLLEGVFRLLSVDKIFQNKKNKIELEMPAWMNNDPNQVARAARDSGNAESIDWLSMFEEGPGFRVRLIPNTEKSISNNFSLIPADKARKYYVKVNSLGFRSSDVEKEKAPNTYRILIFGDSSSFGWGVNQDESFAAIIEKELPAKMPGHKVEALNFAIPGDSSEYGKLIFDRYIAEYSPDLVILGFGANDAKKSFFSHTSQVEKFKSGGTLQSLKYYAGYSSIYRTIDALIKKIQSKEENNSEKRGKVNSVGKKRYAENLKYMGQQSLNDKARQVILLNLCTPGNYAQIAKKVAAANDFTYLNGQALLLKLISDIKEGKIYPEIVAEMRSQYSRELEQNSLYYVSSDACHPNKLGHRIVADQLLSLIAK